MGLVRSDREQVPYLVEQLLGATPENFAVIRQVLESFKEDFIQKLWDEFASPAGNSERRFRRGPRH